ncbi:MAG: AAA family ATPase [Clostridia bacterium]|nr:AAA family ATPase [Clostridia bacterium]
MKEKCLIIITGMSATGKTTNGIKIASKLGMPFFSKDRIKEILFDATCNEDATYEDKRKIGAASYDILYHDTEVLMKSGYSFILESNFVKQSSDILKKLISKYNYNSITIRFEADLKVLHERFLERENTTNRHKGLVANGAFDDFKEFEKLSNKCKEFKINDNEIVIDTTDFSNIDIDEIVGNINRRM